jgi:single-strand selective monofunctional uracil DNA glycosylase
MNLHDVSDALLEDLKSLRFGPPVTHVYNPLEYARKPYDVYLERYAAPPKEIVLIGMNPGPWGMVQTGVPFGEIKAVKEWLEIEEAVGHPAELHPKRPVEGFDCERREVSGQRLWGWARENFETPQRFFKRFWVGNYCPLLFIEASGRNRTPNQLHVGDRKPLFAACDRALRRTIAYLKPGCVVGVGKFAGDRAAQALTDFEGVVGRITHPSPANPRANRGWGSLATEELRKLGIEI